MSNDVNPNKINDKQKREANNLKSKYMHQGMGRDEAEDRALTEASEPTNSGGGNSGGDAKKHANSEGSGRDGSDKDAG